MPSKFGIYYLLYRQYDMCIICLLYVYHTGLHMCVSVLYVVISFPLRAKNEPKTTINQPTNQLPVFFSRTFVVAISSPSAEPSPDDARSQSFPLFSTALDR